MLHITFIAKYTKPPYYCIISVTYLLHTAYFSYKKAPIGAVACPQWGVFPFSDGTMYVDVSLPITATVLAVASVDYCFNSSAIRIDLPRCVSIEGYSLQSKTRLRALSAYDGMGHVQYIALTKID